MASRLVPASASFTPFSAVSTSSFSEPSNFSPWSLSSFSVWYTSVSALLRTSASSRRFRSSSACASASRTMRSMSSLASEDWPVIVIDCSLPVALSWADTWTIPLASMSKVTSICGIPRGAGGRSTSWNLPSVLLYIAISRSPWSTWISTDGWLSSAVVKISDRLVGMVVFRSIRRCMTCPLVSMPSDSGVTSSNRTSLTSPLRTPACTAAPMATTSSGLTPLWGSLPVRLCTSSWTAGMRVEPPAAGLDQVGGEVVELRPRQLEVEVLGALGRGRDEGQVDLGVLHGGQLDLRLLRRLLQSLQGHLVAGQVDALGVLELGHQPVDDLVVPVVTAELGVARGGLDLEDAFADLEHGDVERPAAEVEDEDRLVLPLLVEAVGQRSGRRLVDDAEHLEPGDRPGLLGGRALRVVEVRRHGDDGLVDGVAEIRLGVPLQLPEDPGRDLLGRVRLAVDVNGPAGAHVPLHGADGAVGVGDGLALGHLADEHLARLGEAHHRGGRPATLRVRDHDGL